MLIYYFVIHSTVTKIKNARLLGININHLKQNIMRTLNTNQLTGTLENTRSNSWNSKRRFRS
ncbi:hypothetical protein GCM10009431_19840 [Gaetbulibacter jejuensis]|uniref:Uncharacterized protein n=1 Tax=Gaetbulibacter jejuensis TaxID=584607 RepID=A0ABN1JR99_9FLAO